MYKFITISTLLSLSILIGIKNIKGSNLNNQPIKKEIKDENPDFILINNKNYDSIYEDVTSQSEKSFGNSHGRSTNVHETAHMIHAKYRNIYKKEYGKCNAFYCLKGRIVVLKEPNLLITDVIVPENLRGYRYDLYFRKQLKYWNDSPTYIFDEWNAYILGAECAVEDHQKNICTEKTDAVSGCFEFSIYSVAVCMAIKEKHPEYWEKEENLKKFMKFNLKRAAKAFKIGKDVFKSPKQTELYNKFKNDNTTKDFMLKEFNVQMN